MGQEAQRQAGEFEVKMRQKEKQAKEGQAMIETLTKQINAKIMQGENGEMDPSIKIIIEKKDKVRRIEMIVQELQEKDTEIK